MGMCVSVIMPNLRKHSSNECSCFTDGPWIPARSPQAAAAHDSSTYEAIQILWPRDERWSTGPGGLHGGQRAAACKYSALQIYSIYDPLKIVSTPRKHSADAGARLSPSLPTFPPPPKPLSIHSTTTPSSSSSRDSVRGSVIYFSERGHGSQVTLEATHRVAAASCASDCTPTVGRTMPAAGRGGLTFQGRPRNPLPTRTRHPSRYSPLQGCGRDVTSFILILAPDVS